MSSNFKGKRELKNLKCSINYNAKGVSSRHGKAMFTSSSASGGFRGDLSWLFPQLEREGGGGGLLVLVWCFLCIFLVYVGALYAFYKTSITYKKKIEAYTDVDWVGSIVDARFTLGYCTFVGGNWITWHTEKSSWWLPSHMQK